MSLMKINLLITLAILYLLQKTIHARITLLNEFYRINNSNFCSTSELIYFKESLYEICVKKENSNSYIFTRKSNDLGKSWEPFNGPLNSKFHFKYIYVFSTKNNLIIVYGYIRYNFRYEGSEDPRFTVLISDDGEKFKESDASMSSYNIYGKLFNSYAAYGYKLDGNDVLLLCSLDKNVVYRDHRVKFAECLPSYDNGLNWQNNVFEIYIDSNFHSRNNPSIYVKNFGNTFGFVFQYTHNNEVVKKFFICNNPIWNLKQVCCLFCPCPEYNKFECKEHNEFTKNESTFMDISKINDKYIYVNSTKNTSTKKSLCLYFSNYDGYMYNNISDTKSASCSKTKLIYLNNEKTLLTNYLDNKLFGTLLTPN